MEEGVKYGIADLVGSRVPRDRGRAGRASLPGFAIASIENHNRNDTAQGNMIEYLHDSQIEELSEDFIESQINDTENSNIIEQTSDIIISENFSDNENKK